MDHFVFKTFQNQKQQTSKYKQDSLTLMIVMGTRTQKNHAMLQKQMIKIQNYKVVRVNTMRVIGINKNKMKKVPVKIF